MAFTSLGKMLPMRLKQTGIHREVQSSRVVSIANEILNEWYGPKTTETNAQAISVKYKQVNVATTNASLRQELHFKKDQFVAEVNKRIGEELVERLQLVI